jgi:hypothetical protein
MNRRTGESAAVSRGSALDTKTVTPRPRNLNPITKAVYWEDLPTLPNGEGRDVLLEFGKVVRCGK